MNKKIIIGSLISVIILMMLPSISAIEFDSIKKANKILLKETILNIKTTELIEKFKDDSIQPQFIGIIGLILGILLGVLKRFTVSISIAIIGVMLAFVSFILRSIAGIFKLVFIWIIIIAMVIFGITVMEQDNNSFYN